MEQFEVLQKRLELKLTEFPHWRRFVEAAQRRNLLTHCDGIVSEQYLSVCRKPRAIFLRLLHARKLRRQPPTVILHRTDTRNSVTCTALIVVSVASVNDDDGMPIAVRASVTPVRSAVICDARAT